MTPEYSDKLTEEQFKAVTVTGKNLLVSADAGSGKTRTLARRAVRILMDEENRVDPDSLLIATFTKAAAAQMRSRISKLLAEQAEQKDPRAAAQLMLLDTAHIGTIDSFLLWTVRQYGDRLGLPNSIKIAPEDRAVALCREVLSRVISEKFDSLNDHPDEDSNIKFKELADLLTEKDSSGLENAVIELNEILCKQPDPEAWLDTHLNELSRGDGFREIAAKLAEEYAGELEKLRADAEKEGLEEWEKYLNVMVGRLKDEAEQLRKSRTALGNFTLKFDEEDIKKPTLFKKTASDEEKIIDTRFKAVRDRYEKYDKNEKGKFAEVCRSEMRSEKDKDDDRRKAERYARELAELCRVYRAKLEEEKIEKGIFDFSDISAFACKLLLKTEDGKSVPTDIAEELRKQFSEILIDEFQDINPLQYEIFKAISNGKNIFAVGDIKQCVYRFRDASPQIFADLYNEYYKNKERKDESSGKLICLNKNYRSDPALLDAVNFIFSRLMSGPPLSPIEYKAMESGWTSANKGERGGAQDCGKNEDKIRADAEFCKKRIDEQMESDCPDKFIPPGGFEIAVDFGEIEDKIRADAEFCKKRIDELLDTYIPSDIPSESGPRKATLSDFCIITPRNDTCAKIADFLNEKGIAAYTCSGEQFFRRPEINAVLSALWAADNPMNDVAVLSALMSPIWNFSPDELAEVRQAGDGKSKLWNALGKCATGDGDTAKHCRGFREDLEQLRLCASILPLGQLVSSAAGLAGFENFCATLGDPRSVKDNISRLIRYADEMDDRGSTLSDFVRSVGDSYAERRLGSTEGRARPNAVTVATIHKSKGLEYPVVILAGLHHLLIRSSAGDVIFDSEGGIGIKLPDEKGGGKKKKKSVSFAAVELLNKRSELSEKLRCLYVAMTRAKHRLIVSCHIKEKELKSLAEKKAGGEFGCGCAGSCQSYQDLLLAAAMAHPSGKMLRDRLKKAGGVDFQEIHGPDGKEWKEWQVTFTEKSGDAGGAAPEAKKPEPDDTLWEKISERLDYSYPRAHLTVRPEKFTVTGLLENSAELRTAEPSFASGAGGAVYGTELHSFMQMCDLKKAREDGARREAERLRGLGKLSSQTPGLLRFTEIDSFFSSPLFARLAECGEILREYNFTARMQYSELFGDTEESEDSTVILQGCADCIGVRPDSLLLIDYKTDSLSRPEEFVVKYARQLRLYAACLKKIFGLGTCEKYIYSFRLRREIPII